jgi:hypothetical protein
MGRRVRTALIRNAKEFSVAFTIAVTEATDNPQHWIAKKGKDSIFSVLNDIFPQASWIRFGYSVVNNAVIQSRADLH